MNADQIWRAIESRVLRAIQGYKPSSLAMFPVPVSYTPVWTASTSNPSIGNGTLVGRYVLRGKTCLTFISLVGGSTTNWGSGVWTFGLAVAVKPTGIPYQGQAHCYDASTGSYYGRIPAITNGTNLTVINNISGTGSQLSPTVPFTWGSGDLLRIQLEYEIE